MSVGGATAVRWSGRDKRASEGVGVPRIYGPLYLGQHPIRTRTDHLVDEHHPDP
ncbi:hypothetical protein NJ7G_2742 [Natrinema sp. J7-2]|nr:hypothetical protein NJ7G_2742 [Natrinema sp. J7-2]